MDPRLAAAIEIEREADALFVRAHRRLDEDVNEVARMKRKAQMIREEVAAERELDSIAEHVGSSIRARKQRRAA